MRVGYDGVNSTTDANLAAPTDLRRFVDAATPRGWRHLAVV